MMVTPMELFAGVALDFAAGDPRWLPHPVAGIGRLAAAAEKAWRASGIPARVAGALTWLTVTGVVCGTVAASLAFLPSPWIQIYWIFSFLAVRSLDSHAAAVIACLRAGDVGAARASVAMIVGRDTADLDEPEITRAVFETVAESLNDGVIAPLFWLAVGGPAGMAAYKVTNTLDSMFGHRNERYREFGWASARTDDLANLIPARLTALLVWIIALLLPGLSGLRSIQATLRDAHRQPSPNAGYPEAAVAGALGVRLGGVNVYGGVPSPKHFLGDAARPLRWNLFGSLRRLVYSTSVLFVLLLGWMSA
ncbi:MAG TPA: adenosylcobinamide-phosphate synthase CbiB [Bryobacteraceae bacterium]|jgi:adenosylcobinamide-phosphate synthase|nr:adenosylcobinamide-phosphate synthase CbiB [Bryobacteraceae bacterium]